MAGEGQMSLRGINFSKVEETVVWKVTAQAITFCYPERFQRKFHSKNSINYLKVRKYKPKRKKNGGGKKKKKKIKLIQHRKETYK